MSGALGDKLFLSFIVSGLSSKGHRIMSSGIEKSNVSCLEISRILPRVKNFRSLILETFFR